MGVKRSMQEAMNNTCKPTKEYMANVDKAIRWASTWGPQYQNENRVMAAQVAVCFKAGNYSIAVTKCCGQASEEYASHASEADLHADLDSLAKLAIEDCDRNHREMAERKGMMVAMLQMAIESGAVMSIDKIDPSKVN